MNDRAFLGQTSTDVAQNRLEKRRKERERKLEEAFVAVLSTPNGKRVFRWLLFGPCGFYNATYGDKENARDINWREGRRSVGLAVIQKLRDFDFNLWRDLVSEDVAEYLEDQLHRRDAERPQQETEDAD